MSKPAIALEFWMKIPMLKFVPIVKGPKAGGLAGQALAAAVVKQTRPVTA